MIKGLLEDEIHDPAKLEAGRKVGEFLHPMRQEVRDQGSEISRKK